MTFALRFPENILAQSIKIKRIGVGLLYIIYCSVDTMMVKGWYFVILNFERVFIVSLLGKHTSGSFHLFGLLRPSPRLCHDIMHNWNFDLNIQYILGGLTSFLTMHSLLGTSVTLIIHEMSILDGFLNKAMVLYKHYQDSFLNVFALPSVIF